jgi:aminoglycoside 6-adenylyltransferase
MDRTPNSMPELLDRIVSWAQACPDIRGVLLVGSQARSNRPADEWSDLDLAIITIDPDRYLSRTDWLEQLGHPWITFLEGTIVGALERRVLYEGALDVDFNFFTPEWLQRLLIEVAAGAEGVNSDVRVQPRHEVAVAASVLRRGVRVLLDKDGTAAALLPVSEVRPAARPPEEAEFLNVVNDFWYHAVWTAKKLRRGELYIAKGCCDSYMKRLLTDMIVCHAHVTHGWDYET